MYKGLNVVLFLLFSFTSFAQSTTRVNVNRDIDLTKVYTQVVKEGYGTPEIYKELANAYYFKSNYSASKKWYEKLFSEVDIQDEVIIYRYKQSLKALGMYSPDNAYLVARTKN